MTETAAVAGFVVDEDGPMRAPGWRFLYKPFCEDDLLNALQAALPDS